ncbi:MAG: nuclear transport factor 2 family protein [Microbacterium sp.]
MGAVQERNLAAARAFYGAGASADDAERRAFFADDFTWHVPGDTDLSVDYSGEAYFVTMPARMAPLDEFDVRIESLAANRELVIAVARIRGLRRGRRLDVVGGHVLRFSEDARIVEAWGWCADQQALDAFFAEP